MGSVRLGTIGPILSGDSTVSAEGKTLIITAHGRLTGTTFTKPYYAAVSFASEKYGALLAALNDAIDGKIQAAELAGTGLGEQDHALAWYDHDPGDSAIVTRLSGKKVDVLRITSTVRSTRAANAPTLSEVMTQLKAQSLEYPEILCLFCRVVKNVTTGEATHKKSVVGGEHATAQEANSKMKDAISIAQALKAKWGSGA